MTLLELKAVAAKAKVVRAPGVPPTIPADLLYPGVEPEKDSHRALDGVLRILEATLPPDPRRSLGSDGARVGDLDNVPDEAFVLWDAIIEALGGRQIRIRRKNDLFLGPSSVAAGSLLHRWIVQDAILSARETWAMAKMDAISASYINQTSQWMRTSAGNLQREEWWRAPLSRPDYSPGELVAVSGIYNWILNVQAASAWVHDPTEANMLVARNAGFSTSCSPTDHRVETLALRAARDAALATGNVNDAAAAYAVRALFLGPYRRTHPQQQAFDRLDLAERYRVHSTSWRPQNDRLLEQARGRFRLLATLSRVLPEIP